MVTWMVDVCSLFSLFSCLVAWKRDKSKLFSMEYSPPTSCWDNVTVLDLFTYFVSIVSCTFDSFEVLFHFTIVPGLSEEIPCSQWPCVVISHDKSVEVGKLITRLLHGGGGTDHSHCLYLMEGSSLRPSLTGQVMVSVCSERPSKETADQYFILLTLGLIKSLFLWGLIRFMQTAVATSTTTASDFVLRFLGF